MCIIPLENLADKKNPHISAKNVVYSPLLKPQITQIDAENIQFLA